MSTDTPRELFIKVLRLHPEVQSDSKRFDGLLKDYFRGEYRKEATVLSNCIREGISDTLRSLNDRTQYAILSNHLVCRLVDNWGNSEEIARWAVDSWGIGLGIIQEEELRPEHQTLFITSNPPGSTIKIDGIIVGITPQEVKPISTGLHQVACSKEGYEKKISEVTISSGQQAQITFNLKESVPPISHKPATASYVINSDPSVAATYLDEKYIGRTPLRMSGVQPGSHIIRCSLSGFNDQSITSHVSRFEEKYHKIVLQRSVPSTGEIQIQSIPPGSDIHFDSVYRGVTPLKLENISSGQHDIGCSHDGYQKKMTTEKIQPGQMLTVNFNLEKINQTLYPISIYSRPPGATVFIDKNNIGRTPLTIKAERPGQISLECVAPGYQYWRQKINIQSDSNNVLNIDLIPNKKTGGQKQPSLMPRPMGITLVCLMTVIISLLILVKFLTNPIGAGLFSIWGLVSTYFLYNMRKIGAQSNGLWALVIVLLLSPSGNYILVAGLIGTLLILGYYRSYFIE